MRSFSLVVLWLGALGTVCPGAEDQPTLAPGKWALIEWIAPDFPRESFTVTIAQKEGRPAVTAIEDDTFKWQPKGGVTVTGRRVTFAIVREGPLEYRFDGLFDPSGKRIVGSLWSQGLTAERVVLELIPAPGARKSKPPERPAEWLRYYELARENGEAWARAQAPAPKDRPPAEQAAIQAAASASKEKYFKEVPKLFRKLVAEQPNSPFGFQAAMELFGLLDQLKPGTTEIDVWAKVARKFASTHGQQFEAATLGRIAGRLTRHAPYAAQARALAAEADKLALAAGMTEKYSAVVNAYEEERAAWATQTQPPPEGSTWTVEISGRVTDRKGKPIPDVNVLVNNTQWAKTSIHDQDSKVKTDTDGRYKITLRCQGSYRVHVTQIWADKPGFVHAVNDQRHKLFPGQTANVDFTLKSGELFGGTLKLRPDSRERDGEPKELHLLKVIGPGVDESLTVENGGKFELALPPGTYTVELGHSRRKKLSWTGLRTGKTDHVLEEPAFRFTPETVGAGFDEMWQAMDRSYSYFVLKPDVDWAKVRDEYRPKAIRAKSADELSAVLTEMLGHLKDGHVWIEMPNRFIGTHRVRWSYNGNRQAIMAQLTDTTECGKYAIVGKTKPDGFGYFLMTQQGAATPELVAKAVAAIDKLADAPGFIVDLRNSNGGSEPLAQEIARLFCARDVVYAKSRFRNGKGHDEFTEDQPRHLLPVKSGKAFQKPVVCLLGPGCVSSGEGFAKMMAALPQVTTVGLPTRGSSGNPAPVDVGDTGIVVYFSRWVDLLPDGTPIEGKGVPPTVRVDAPAEAYRGADPTLAKGLEVLRGKVRNEK
jgi:hypothetical protein